MTGLLQTVFGKTHIFIRTNVGKGWFLNYICYINEIYLTISGSVVEHISELKCKISYYGTL